MLRCWRVAFDSGDHEFLHMSKIFPILRRLMSPEEELPVSDLTSLMNTSNIHASDKSESINAVTQTILGL